MFMLTIIYCVPFVCHAMTCHHWLLWSQTKLNPFPFKLDPVTVTSDTYFKLNSNSNNNNNNKTSRATVYNPLYSKVHYLKCFKQSWVKSCPGCDLIQLETELFHAVLLYYCITVLLSANNSLIQFNERINEWLKATN